MSSSIVNKTNTYGIPTKFTTGVATKDIWLQNTEAHRGDPDYVKHEIIKAGETFDCRVQYFSDGRIYYTAYKIIDGACWCRTDMRRGAELQLNCGGMNASREILQALDLISKHKTSQDGKITTGL